MVGRSEAGVIVQTPDPSQPAPVTLNAIVSMPEFALASRIAWRREPAPESLVFVTVKVEAGRADATSRAARPTRSRMTGTSSCVRRSLSPVQETGAPDFSAFRGRTRPAPRDGLELLKHRVTGAGVRASTTAGGTSGRQGHCRWNVFVMKTAICPRVLLLPGQ